MCRAGIFRGEADHDFEFINVQLWIAFILGLAGSLHCAAMCGPLALLVPVTGLRASQRVLSRVTYNIGRLLTYAVLGGLFGLFGRAFAIAGLQRWLSLAAGSLNIIGLIISVRPVLAGPLTHFVQWVKASFSSLSSRRTLLSIGTLGALNGLLPCGLVYVACAGSAAAGDALSGVGYMLAFGIGTVPMLLVIGNWRFFTSFKLRCE